MTSVAYGQAFYFSVNVWRKPIPEIHSIVGKKAEEKLPAPRYRWPNQAVVTSQKFR